jgi:UDP-N-acetylmuramyl-tripeptide synthetase
MTDYGCDAIVMEASSHALMLAKLDPIPFDIGIFTGLSHEHLDFHESMDSYFEAKEKLIKNAKRVIINFDDPRGKILYDKYRDKATGIGVVFRSDTNAENVESRGLSGIGYICRKKSFLTRIKLPLPGIYNIYNSMLAFECAYRLNVPPAIIREALSSLSPIDGRSECIRDEVTVVIDDAHTPLALENLLRCAAEERYYGRKLHTVFGCGGDRDKEKRPLMARIAEKYSDRVTVTSDNPRSEDPQKIISDILTGFTDTRHTVIIDRADAIGNAILGAKNGDIIVIAGKGHERYICDKDGYHHFDEREIIFSALKLRKERG